MIRELLNWWRRRTWLRAALQEWRAEVDEQPYPSMDDVYRRYISGKEDPPKGAR